MSLLPGRESHRSRNLISGVNGIHGRTITALRNLRPESVPAPRQHPIPRREHAAVMLCPVCLQGVETDDRRTVGRHRTSVGNWCPMSGQVGPDWDERSTREAVPGRSGGTCEHCQRARAQDMAHRRASGVGGRWSPANILHLCRRCHRRAHEYPTWANAVGLRLKEGEDPEQRPVTREDGSTFQPTDDVAMPIPK